MRRLCCGSSALATTRCCGNSDSGQPTPPPQGGDDTVKDFFQQRMLKITTRKKPPRGTPITTLLEYNRQWASEVTAVDPNFFHDLAQQQSPQYLWIGCSDSRVPANQVVGLSPGEVFVHRNVANVVSRSDLNCLSVLQFAVEVLKVEHVIVCGHYGCGGVMAALRNARLGIVDHWILHVADVKQRHWDRLLALPESRRLNALCELNVITQLANVAESPVIKDWWASTTSHRVELHGWIYGLDNGIVTPLMTLTSKSTTSDALRSAVDDTFRRHLATK